MPHLLATLFYVAVILHSKSALSAANDATQFKDAHFEESYFRDHVAWKNCKVKQKKSKVLAWVKLQDFLGKDRFLESMDRLPCKLNNREIEKLEISLKQRQALSRSRKLPFLASAQKGDMPELELTKLFPIKSGILTQCPSITPESKREGALAIHSRPYWHQLFLNFGYNCAAKHFNAASYALNSNNIWAFEQLRSTTQAPRPNLNGMHVVLVPHYGYERGYLAGEAEQKKKFFPWLSFAIPKGTFERFDYENVKKHLEQLGATVSIAFRKSNSNFNEQVSELHRSLSTLQKPYVVLSRSAGAQVVDSYLQKYSKPTNMKLWINLGGTPKGSIVPHKLFFSVERFVQNEITAEKIKPLKMAPLVQYFPGLSKQSKNLILNFIYDAINLTHVRQMLSTEVDNTPLKPKKYKNLQVINYNFFASDFKALSEKVAFDQEDAALAGMLRLGPAEGSSLWADMAVDTHESLRILQQGDHFYFRGTQDEVAFGIIDRIFGVYAEIRRSQRWSDPFR